MAVLYVFLLCFLGFAACSQYERSLNGPGWLVKDTGGRVKEFVNATVPGQVHLDLMWVVTLVSGIMWLMISWLAGVLGLLKTHMVCLAGHLVL